MTDTTITTNIHQSFNVQLYLRAKITFHLVLCANDLTNLGSLIVRPVLNLQILVYASLIQYFS